MKTLAFGENSLYNEFLTYTETKKQSIDFLGINISDSHDRFNFKMYCEVESGQYKHRLLRFLEENDMLRYSSVVITDKPDKFPRYEIGLKNRSNSNMDILDKWLCDNSSFYEAYRDKIEYFSKMKISNDGNYERSALYFLGFAGENEEIDVIKTHFLTRRCNNPNISHKEYEYDNKYYLKYLFDSGIEEMKALVRLSEKALLLCGGNLWMAGFDCDRSNNYKYKIYIKKPSELYGGLIDLFGDATGELTEKTKAVMEWNNKNKEYIPEGFALGIDNKNSLSVNFYY